jgi:hypothetical protein
MLVESFFQAAGTSTVEDYLGRSEAASTAAPEYLGNELLTTGPHPDAKLVELGVEYERLLALEEPLSEESARLWNAADRLRYQKLGIDPEDKEACRAALDDRHSEWMEARNSADKEVGYDKAWHKTDRASRKTARIGKKILKIAPTTITGLLVRARVIETHDEICDIEPAEQLLAEIRDFAKELKAASV